MSWFQVMKERKLPALLLLGGGLGFWFALVGELITHSFVRSGGQYIVEEEI